MPIIDTHPDLYDVKNRFIAKENFLYKILIEFIQPLGGGEFKEEEGAW